MDNKVEIMRRLEYSHTGILYHKDDITMTINTITWWDNTSSLFISPTVLVIDHKNHIIRITFASINRLCAVIKLLQEESTSLEPKRYYYLYIFFLGAFIIFFLLKD